MNRKPIKGKGTCRVCWAEFKTHSSDGTIHRHGPRPSPCPGSSQPPAEILAPSLILSPSSTTDSENHSSIQTQPDSDGQHVPPLSTLFHRVVRGALVKRIPRSARASCAA